MTIESIIKDDAQYIWHPITQHKTAAVPKAIASASGNYLVDMDGDKYLDAISSWYTCSYGHANPILTQAIKNQVDTLHHVVFAGMTHEPAITLAKKLLAILPHNQEKVFYSENGSTSVEIALKMAFQYHFNNDDERNVIIALADGFHGDTFGAMSASGLSVYNGPFENLLLEVKRIPAPTIQNIESVLEIATQLLKTHKVASFIYEPLVQGAAAMQMNDSTGICRLLKLFKAHGVVTIADEVMTGFGKTGTLFASDQILNKPDIMCLSKALTGGIMPMAVTTCAQHIYDAFYKDQVAAGFFHGHTYSGNPLGCAVASAAIDILKNPATQNNIQYITQQNERFVMENASNEAIKNLRCCGVILAMDLVKPMERYGAQRNAIFEWFWKSGIFLRPLGSTLYIVPPFTTTREQLDFLHHKLLEFVESSSF